MGRPREHTIRRYLDELYGDDAPGTLVIFDKHNKRSKCFASYEFDEAAAIAAHWAVDRDVYHGIGLQTERVSPYRRGTSDTVIAIPGLYLDVDIASEAHKQSDLPATLDEALALAHSFPLEPTLIVHTGHGIQPHWLFNELWIFESEEERRAAGALLRRFQKHLRDAAAERGWSIESTADLARVLRPVGTINHKLDPVRTREIEFNEASRYEADEIASYLPDDTVCAETWSPANPDDFAPADLSRIANECAWMAHCQTDAATLNEPEWYAMLSIIGRCKDGDFHAHEWSSPHPGYSAAETDAKLAQARTRSGPRTCRDIRESLRGERYCSTCSHWGKVKSPIRLGEHQWFRMHSIAPRQLRKGVMRFAS